jgi:hypothetical protein
LPKTEIFLSLCAENDFKISRLNNDEKKITLLHNFKMEKMIQNIMVVNYDLDFEKTESFLKLNPTLKRK